MLPLHWMTCSCIVIRGSLTWTGRLTEDWHDVLVCFIRSIIFFFRCCTAVLEILKSPPYCTCPHDQPPVYLCLRAQAKSQRNLLNAVAGFVILDQQPFNVVEAPSFKYLLQTVSGVVGSQYPSRRAVTDRVAEITTVAADKIRDILKGTRPALTTDNWTANNGVS